MKVLDLFSGIGGFSEGLRQSGVKVEWHGFSEIDKYAIQIYKRHFPEAVELGAIESVRGNDLPKLDLVTFGFPCQDLSIAGKRAGLEGDRSGLFFEAARIINENKPHYFIFENVKGLLSSNGGKDFELVLRTISDSGYDGQWQLLNTSWFLPQNRERIYFIGHPRGTSRPKVFPIGESGTGISKGEKLPKSSCNTLRTNYSNAHSKTGLNQVGELKQKCTKRSFETPKEINEYLIKHKKEFTIREIAEKINTPKTQVEHYFRADSSRAIPNPQIWNSLKELLSFGIDFDKQVCEFYEKQIEFESSQRVYSEKGISPTIEATSKGKLLQVGTIGKDSEATRVYDPKGISRTIKDGGGQGAKTGLYATYRHAFKGFKGYEEMSPSIKSSEGSGNQILINNIRRLTPVECERLQGFPENWTKGISDSQRYKCLGNAVSVPVVKAVIKRLFKEV